MQSNEREPKQSHIWNALTLSFSAIGTKEDEIGHKLNFPSELIQLTEPIPDNETNFKAGKPIEFAQLEKLLEKVTHPNFLFGTQLSFD